MRREHPLFYALHIGDGVDLQELVNLLEAAAVAAPRRRTEFAIFDTN